MSAKSLHCIVCDLEFPPDRGKYDACPLCKSATYDSDEKPMSSFDATKITTQVTKFERELVEDFRGILANLPETQPRPPFVRTQLNTTHRLYGE